MAATGFSGAPITKYLLVATVGASILSAATTAPNATGAAHLQSRSAFQVNDIFALAGYTHPASLVFALGALYSFRSLERLWGSGRFATLLSTALPASLILIPTTLGLTRALLPGTPSPSGGAVTVILFALAANYYAVVPPAWRYRSTSLFGAADAGPAGLGLGGEDASVKVSAKFPEYLACAQVAVAQGPGSLVCAVSGWISGWAWRAGMAAWLRSGRADGAGSTSTGDASAAVASGNEAQHGSVTRRR